jgi:hypothetical protein
MKLYVALVTTGDAVLATVAARFVDIFAFAGSKPPPLAELPPW